MEGPRNKKELEILLQGLKELEIPKPELEQHSTPPDLASSLIHLAHLMGDLEGARTADLGCGNGILAIGAVLYGASRSVGVDIDPDAIKVARMNAELMGISDRTEFLVMDVVDFNDPVDLVLQNPPFGVVIRHADLRFLYKALEISRVVYSIHMAGNSRFLAEHASKRGAKLTYVERWPFPLRRIFQYHRRKIVNVPVEILRFEVIT